jgi:hypothetical protein
MHVHERLPPWLGTWLGKLLVSMTHTNLVEPRMECRDDVSMMERVRGVC